MALIEVENISKVYRLGRVEVPALRGVSLNVEEGDFVAIMGPSGSGKSTLMNIIGCLDRPTSGRYRLEGKDVGKLGDTARAWIRSSKIGFVFQSFNLLPQLSALRNVLLPTLYGPNTKDVRRARQILSDLGLGDRMRHRPMEMSGGEQQRVAIARALINDPPIIFADEPTGNLDTATGNEIIGILERLSREGKTIIMVTHEPDIAQHAKRMLHFRDGVIEWESEGGVATGDAWRDAGSD